MHYWNLTGILYIAAEIAVGFTAITGNFIILVTIMTDRSLHKITYLFIGNLAVADIAVGIVVTPCALLTFFGLPSEKYECIVIFSAILVFTNISILILLTIVVERCIAVHNHDLYEKYITITSARIVILSTWVIGAILGLLPLFGWNNAPTFARKCRYSKVMAIEHTVYFQFFTMTLVPIVIMFSIYIHLYWFSAHATESGRTSHHGHRRRSRLIRHHLLKDMKTTKLFAIISLLFAIFWLPINIMNAISLFCPTCHRPFDLIMFTIVLSHAYSSVKPIVYVTHSHHFRTAIKDMLSNELSYVS